MRLSVSHHLHIEMVLMLPALELLGWIRGCNTFVSKTVFKKKKTTTTTKKHPFSQQAKTVHCSLLL